MHLINPSQLSYSHQPAPAWRHWLVVFFLGFIALVLAQASHASVGAGTMSVDRSYHSATTLPDGRVLVAGGYSSSASTNVVELYDPATGSFTLTTPMNGPRSYHGAALLPGGRVLVVGGSGANFALQASAEIYDIASATWRTVGSMSTVRRLPRVVPLADGRVLVIGSDVDSGNNSSEIFDPVSETFGAAVTIPFNLAARISVSSASAAVGLLPDGRVLFAGGITSGASINYLSAAYLWDPVTNQWSATGSLSVPRYSGSFSLLPNGKVLLAGGHTDLVMTNTSDVYDPATGLFSAGPTLVKTRMEHLAVTQADGSVLLVGGIAASYSLETTIERYDPQSNSFAAVGSLLSGRRASTANLVAGGRVLSIGGGNDARGAEFYDVACAVAPIQLSGSSQSFGGGGGTGSVQVTAPAGCAWDVRRVPSWLTITAGATGVGNGTVNFTAAPSVVDYGQGSTLLIGQVNFAVDEAARLCNPAAQATLSAGNVFVGSGAATVVENLTYDIACTWSVGTLPSWVSVSTGTTGKGNASIVFNFQSNPTANTRSATITVANATMNVQQDANCSLATPSILPQSASFNANGGSATIAVTQSASCSWSSFGFPSWVTLNANSGGLGSATMYYTVAPNTGAARSVTLTIAGYSFVISQSSGLPACDPAAIASLSATSQSFPATASSGSVALTYVNGCAWSTTGAPSWVTITGGVSSQGSGTVSFSLAANTGPARSATLIIAGKSFVINQASGGLGCDPAAVPTLSSSSQSFTASGSSGYVTLTYVNGCAWTTTGAPSWVTVTTGLSGQGSNTINFTLAANTGAARSATLSIAGKSFTINQSAAIACNTNSIGQGVTINGNLSSLTACTNGARGSGYYTDRYTFTATAGQQISIQLSSGAFDTYLYLKDPNGTVIASNDDGGGGTNSRIPASTGLFTLPAGAGGTYTIEVTSYYAAGGGAYTLLRN
jgi:hypothetical protein